MSCNSNNTVPCCCPPDNISVSTCDPFPPCNNGEKCDEVVLTDCIIHNGISVPCLNIFPGQTYTEILVAILNEIC